MFVLRTQLFRSSFVAKMAESLQRDIERAQRVQQNVQTHNYEI